MASQGVVVFKKFPHVALICVLESGDAERCFVPSKALSEEYFWNRKAQT